VPAGVIEATPPAGFWVLAVIPVVLLAVEMAVLLTPVVEASRVKLSCPPFWEVGAVSMWVWPGSVTETVWVWLMMEENGVPEKSGTPAGQEIVWAGTVPLEPVKVGAEAPSVPTPCRWVPKAAPVKVGALLVPVGVPALSPEVLAEEPVKMGWLTVPLGVPALSEDVVSGLPMNVGALTVPTGVSVSLPPVVPTSA
jgi:hypothetical protein